eukprot:NODE_466_length_7077_cov_0.565205.p4 type:complete len:209 gc:universal NODE_466_length_7077_cov_0.565205:1820-1194(-)
MFFAWTITFAFTSKTVLYNTPDSEGNRKGPYIVRHGYNVCQVDGNELKCGSNSKSLQKKKITGDSGWSTIPYSIDFYGKEFCMVAGGKDGTLICDIIGSFTSDTYKLDVGMNGRDILDIRISYSHHYMCALNWNNQVWCMELGVGTKDDPVFDKKREFTSIVYTDAKSNDRDIFRITLLGTEVHAQDSVKSHKVDLKQDKYFPNLKMR